MVLSIERVQMALLTSVTIMNNISDHREIDEVFSQILQAPCMPTRQWWDTFASLMEHESRLPQSGPSHTAYTSGLIPRRNYLAMKRAARRFLDSGAWLMVSFLCIKDTIVYFYSIYIDIALFAQVPPFAQYDLLFGLYRQVFLCRQVDMLFTRMISYAGTFLLTPFWTKVWQFDLNDLSLMILAHECRVRIEDLRFEFENASQCRFMEHYTDADWESNLILEELVVRI